MRLWSIIPILAILLAVVTVPVRAHDNGAPPAVAQPAGVTPSAANDRAALAALYRATDGANWFDDTNWLSDTPLDGWHGVTTDGAGRVTELNLGDNLLAGELPPELGSLANLRRSSL